MPPRIAPRTTDALPPTPTTSDGSPDTLPTPGAAEHPVIVSGRRAVSTMLSLLSELDTNYSTKSPPYSLLQAYTSALSAIPDSFPLAAYYTGQASTITRTPLTSIIPEPTGTLRQYQSTQFVPDYPCGPNQSIPGHALGVATVPASMNATATSTFTIASSIQSCFERYYISETLTLGHEAFTESMKYTYKNGPCPAYYTMDVAYPNSEDPSFYTAVQFMDVIHAGELRGICCPMAANGTDTWNFVGTVCTRSGDTPNATPSAIPYHIRWNAQSEAFATSTVSDGELSYVSTVMFRTTINTPEYTKPVTSGITIASFSAAPTASETNWDIHYTPNDGGDKSLTGPIIGGTLGVLIFVGVVIFLLNRRNSHIMRPPPTGDPPTTRPGYARATGGASQPPTPGLVPRTTADLEADPPPTYSEDLREGEIPLSRLDPNGAISRDNANGSGDGTGNGTGGNTSDGHISWHHLELPTPGYAPSSPGGSVSGGSDRGLLQDIPSQPAPAYTVLRD